MKLADAKYLVIRRDGSVPEWPYFVLGARDPAAVSALRTYAAACQELGMAPGYVAFLLELVGDFEMAQADLGLGHPDEETKIKPDRSVLRVLNGSDGDVCAHHRKPANLGVWTTRDEVVHRVYVIARSAEDAATLASAYLDAAPDYYYDGTGTSMFHRLADWTHLIVFCDEHGVPAQLSGRRGVESITKTCAEWIETRGRGFLLHLGP